MKMYHFLSSMAPRAEKPKAIFYILIQDWKLAYNTVKTQNPGFPTFPAPAIGTKAFYVRIVQ